MYNLASKFNDFYKTRVVLSREEQNELYIKQELNIQRLKSGLDEYNKENRTNYKIVDTYVQGSVAMSTVVQNDNSDYDIDVAVVFDETNLEGKGPLAVRNIIAEAFEKKMGQFKAEPEVKTSCVRIKYADGYHIDFAVFRRSFDIYTGNWIYEHAGNDWNRRDLKGLNEWFKEQNERYRGCLRIIVRLSKMFCRSRDNWKMPSGLIQTVVCSETIQQYYERTDELFYYTMKEVVARLENHTLVFDPIDRTRCLTHRRGDLKKMVNWKNRLKSKLEDLDVLFKNDCSEEEALQAWFGFFNHDYWRGILNENYTLYEKREIRDFEDTEEFIDERFQLNEKYRCNVSCKISSKGFSPMSITEFLGLRKRLPHNYKIQCNMLYTDCPSPYRIFWKVKNVGTEAERRNMIRGQIFQGDRSITENSKFYGNHYIECYIVKDEICVAKKRVEIPIER